MRRRGFLKLGLFGSSLLALGGAGLSLWPSDERHRPRKTLQRIEAARFAVLAQVAARVVPLVGADPIAIAHAVDESIALGPEESAADFNKLLGLLESGLAGFLLDGRPRPFTRLVGEAQDAALEAFRDSRFVLRRAGYHALRKLCVAGYYAGEATWADVGYPGPPQISAPIAETQLPAPGSVTVPIIPAAGGAK